MAAKLLESARKLPPGLERLEFLREIETFRARIAAIASCPPWVTMLRKPHLLTVAEIRSRETGSSSAMTIGTVLSKLAAAISLGALGEDSQGGVN